MRNTKVPIELSDLDATYVQRLSIFHIHHGSSDIFLALPVQQSDDIAFNPAILSPNPQHVVFDCSDSE